MPWWEYESEKKYPFVPAETDPAVDRAGTAFMVLLAALCVFIGSLAYALFARAWTEGLIGLGVAGALMLASRLLMPKPSARR
jgi:hypothetical protein